MAAEYTGLYKYYDPITSKPLKRLTYYLLGVKVDQETYSRYQRLYTIAGDIGGEHVVSLSMLQHCATEQYAKEYPIEAESARRILAQIRAEITSKGENIVKNQKTSRDFIDALAKIYAECRTAYETQQNKLTQARDWMEATQKEAHAFNCQNREIAELRYIAAKAEWRLAEDDTRKEVMNIRDSFSAKVRELREQFESYLDEHYSVSPDKLDTATMQLLNSGICTASELARLAERYKDNPTMLRMVAAHAEKITDERNQSRADYLTCRKVAFVASAAKDGGREMNIFDSAASAAERGLQQDSTVAGRMHNHIVGWFDSFRDQMDDVPNAPAETAAGAEQRRQDRQAAADKALADALAKARGESREDPERATYIQE